MAVAGKANDPDGREQTIVIHLKISQLRAKKREEHFYKRYFEALQKRLSSGWSTRDQLIGSDVGAIGFNRDNVVAKLLRGCFVVDGDRRLSVQVLRARIHIERANQSHVVVEHG